MLKTSKCFLRKCKFYLGIKQPDDKEPGEFNYCAAYPDGIPDDIAYGDDLHLEVRGDQDNDIVYEEAE